MRYILAQRETAKGYQDFTAYTEDAVVDRRVPDACIDSGNFKIRCDNRRSAADRSIQRDSSGIYIFPCDSGYVRSKPPEAVEILICIFSSRVRFPDAWVYFYTFKGVFLCKINLFRTKTPLNFFFYIIP